MATLSTNSAHRIVAGATHDSLLADPGDAAAVSHAIHDVVVSVRTSTPLEVVPELVELEVAVPRLSPAVR
jgi:hypothetical protein